MMAKGQASSVPELHVLLTGIMFGESARWHEGRLWFADWGTGEVIAVNLAGDREVIASIPAFPFSIDWLPDGRLLIVSNELQRIEFDGSVVRHSDLSHLAAGWNELVVDARGNAYVNQAGFDLMSGAEPTTGTIALATPDGAAREVADGLWFPNGMGIFADNSTLIVAESYRNRLSAFDIADGGALANQRVWADLGGGVPDGICIDAEGAVWYADVPNRQCVRVSEGGQVLQTVTLDRGCFSCTLGGPQGRTLFILAAQWNGPEHMFDSERTGQILTIDVSVPAAGYALTNPMSGRQ